MADILLKRDGSLTATYVPNTFIDDYMIHADGEFVKIYLYLLRCMSSPDTACSISDIADKFDHTEKDVTRALKYWEKMQLLHLEFNERRELTGICMSAPGAKAPARSADAPADAAPAARFETSEPSVCCSIAPEAHEPSASAPKKPVIPKRTEYTRQQLAQFHEDETVQELLFVAERYLARTLNHTEIQVIIYWLDKLELTQDMIDYLIEQCVAKNHRDIWYMNRVAVSWAEQGIHTLAAAKQDAIFYNQTVRCVKKAFGISGRSLAGEELPYVRRWSDEFGFSDELIALACERTINRIHQISFGYAHTILNGWHKQNARTLNDVKLLDAQYQEAKMAKAAPAKKAPVRTAKGTTVNGFANFTQRTYDYEELERELLTNSR